MFEPVAVVQIGNALLQVFHVRLDQPGSHVVAGYMYQTATTYPVSWDGVGNPYFMFGMVPVYLNSLAWKN